MCLGFKGEKVIINSVCRILLFSFKGSMWDLPGPGMEPVSPALAGRFFTTEPPGKPSCIILEHTLNGNFKWNNYLGIPKISLHS